MARNPDSALKLGQARGAAICAVVQRGLHDHRICGARKSSSRSSAPAPRDKTQVQHMVGVLLEPAREVAGRRGRCARDRADACARARECRAARRAAPGMETAPMIGRLRGTLLAKQPPCAGRRRRRRRLRARGADVDVLRSAGDGREVALFTHYAVKEDTVVLYGFLREAERTLFRALQKVSGIGAKISLAVLSGVSTDEFARLVQQGDVAVAARAFQASARRPPSASWSSYAIGSSDLGPAAIDEWRGAEGSGCRGDRRAARSSATSRPKSRASCATPRRRAIAPRKSSARRSRPRCADIGNP